MTVEVKVNAIMWMVSSSARLGLVMLAEYFGSGLTGYELHY